MESKVKPRNPVYTYGVPQLMLKMKQMPIFLGLWFRHRSVISQMEDDAQSWVQEQLAEFLGPDLLEIDKFL